MNINDVPIWADHPWRDILSDKHEVRRIGNFASIAEKGGDARVEFSLGREPTDHDIRFYAVMVAYQNAGGSL